MRKLILFAAVLAIPHWAHAAETCLWLNEATAAGILGGPVTLQVRHMTHGMPATGTANAKSSAGPMNANASAPQYSPAGTDDEDCTFTQRAGAVTSEMRIEVRTMLQAHADFTSRLASCGKDRDSLRALGNEAVLCDTAHPAADRPTGISEQVLGRVRDRVFVVLVSANDAAKDRSMLRESAKAAAQIVAGNLF